MPKTSAQTLKALGKKVQKLRKEKELSQEELAHQLGISRVYMGFIEQGRETPSLKLLMKISRKFGVKVEDLFHR
ncbi:MAG TPA: helix-turn-helix transcriptional regulator [Candidatus Woesebacteria bacterium]|nr:helix-turn-helix transcriptional regulator [Candidatus Woesebacteria bacterium]